MSSYKLSLISPSSKEFDTLQDIIANSAPEECVISIEKVENTLLKQRFEDRKKEMEAILGEGNVQTVRVFHGSRDFHSVTNILSDGFKSEYSKVAAFGKGTYFAKNYAYSKNYSGKNVEYKVMMICDILVGVKVKGQANATLSPEKGDVWVDHLVNTSIYSIPNDHQSIPQYVVQFY